MRLKTRKFLSAEFHLSTSHESGGWGEHHAMQCKSKINLELFPRKRCAVRLGGL